MTDTGHNNNSNHQRQILLSLCRLITLRLLHKGLILLLCFTAILLSFFGQSQFAPYGIALVYLLLPSFIDPSASEHTKKENSAVPLSYLCEKYHYSPSALFGYRISYLLCALLLLFWHISLKTPLLLGGLSLPLLYLAVHLALYPFISRILFLVLHRKLMDGNL